MQNKIVVLYSLLSTTAANSPFFYNELSRKESKPTSGKLFKVLHPQPNIPVNHGEYLLIEASALSPNLKELKIFIDAKEAAELYPPYLSYSFNLNSSADIITIKLIATANKNQKQSTTIVLTIIHNDVKPKTPKTMLDPSSIQFIEGQLHGVDRGLLIQLHPDAIPEITKDAGLFIDTKFFTQLTNQFYKHLWQSKHLKLQEKAANEQEEKNWQQASNCIPDPLSLISKPYPMNIKVDTSNQVPATSADSVAFLLQELLSLCQGLPKLQVEQLYNLDSILESCSDLIEPLESKVEPSTSCKVKSFSRASRFKPSYETPHANHADIAQYSRKEDRKH